MSMLDKLKGMLKGHEDQARQGVEKGGDMIDERTGDKYRSQVDMAQKQADDYIDRQRNQQNPPQ
ncbi:antitoxin protein of toxin-antitoxin system [Streptomyces sp. Ag109_O5-1]|uniref:antitoxin n=1 Tax=Streptomyces sp. Ag109_O5-1 TaxID=1938851 RepID=UPI000F4DF24D|nr:antitoxin [Streptomyces sp. Ag109_O5-1]RPE45957.1 antitoxin protein of toxin-antitoxin system [Streptomyces sp. Ag109_O5-1]